jgi:cytochrome c5
MADSHVKMTQTTPQKVIVAVVAGLLAPLLAIVLIVLLVLGIQKEHKPDTSSETAQQATLSRIKPFAQLAALDASVPKVEKSGQEVYDAVCTACHAAGALGAPKFDNKADWSSRIGQGYDTLIKNAVEGIRLMPPRGGNSDLSDVEVARAVAYMANSSGASFKAPEAAEAAAPAPATATGSKPDPVKGKVVFNTNCAVCHTTGAAGAPMLGDKAAWSARISQGFDTLHSHALNGIRAMPAKGGNPSLPDADLVNAVSYLFTEAGGKL